MIPNPHHNQQQQHHHHHYYHHLIHTRRYFRDVGSTEDDVLGMVAETVPELMQRDAIHTSVYLAKVPIETSLITPLTFLFLNSDYVCLRSPTGDEILIEDRFHGKVYVHCIHVCDDAKLAKATIGINFLCSPTRFLPLTQH